MLIGLMMLLVCGECSTSKLEEQEADLFCSEAEYCALACATQEVTWLRERFKDLHNEQTKPTVIHEDNQAAIWTAESPQCHSLDSVVSHFLSNIVILNINVLGILADMMTKGLLKDKLKCLGEMTGVIEMTACK